MVAYQPFHQFYVDTKHVFLEEHGIERSLPLDDGNPSHHAERAAFLAWLQNRRFNRAETNALATKSVVGKGGGLPGWSPPEVAPGSFFEIREALHRAMARHLGCSGANVIGSKEILCEEYVPALLGAGIRCVLIIRDPRAVIASANHGRYRQMVGDRYPLMMLIRLWRKSAAYWLHHRRDPMVRAIRYEDLVADPLGVLSGMSAWLGLGPFASDILDKPLLDHAGKPWLGNSSFGDKPMVDRGGREPWRDLLAPEEQRFIAACTGPEMDAIGYECEAGVGPNEILEFHEDIRGVRTTYLATHHADQATLREEAARLRKYGRIAQGAPDDAARYFLFTEAMTSGDLPGGRHG
jgi:hypothetical protein